jgi:hypothetical protein
MPSLLQASGGLLGAVDEEQETIGASAPAVEPAQTVAPVVASEPNDFWSQDEDALVGPTEVIIEQEEDDDELKGSPGISEANEDYSAFDSFITDANKVAYGAVKGIAGLADLATSPGWSLANVVLPSGQATTMPFSKMLEEAYPAKLYEFEEDPDSYADEMLRFTQTTAEFVTPGGAPNVVSKGVTGIATRAPALIDNVLTEGTSFAKASGFTAGETAAAAASGITYQGVLEGGGSEEVALLTSFLTPMAPQVASSGWSVLNAAPKTAWRKAENVHFLGPVLSEARVTKETLITNLQNNLRNNPEQWEGNLVTRLAKKAVLSVEDTVAPIDAQINNLKTMKDRIDNIIPQDNPEVAAHVNRMKKMQDVMNKGRPEGDQLELTLDQVYRPVLDKMNDVDGFDKLLGVAKLTNGDAYNAQIKNNQRIFGEFLNDGFDKLTAEDSEAFMHVFRGHLDDINSQQEILTNAALKTDFVGNTSSNTIYEFPYIPMEKELVKATENIRNLMGDAYEGMLNKLDGDIELDTTPIKNSITEAYTDMGTLGDPRSVPTYMKALMQKLVAIGEANNPKAMEAEDAHKLLLNREADLSAQQTQLKREKNELVKIHKARLESIPEDLDVKEARELRKQYQAEYDTALEPITSARQPLDDELANITVAKRERATATEDAFDRIPEPNLTNLDSVRKATRTVAKDRREAFRAGDMDKYQNLTTLYKGLEETMESLKDIDAPAYEMYSSVQGRYKDFVSRDFNESHAKTIIDKKGGHERKLTSDQAVAKVWNNGDAESIQRFMRNFDDTRNGMDDYLSHADNEQIKGADAMAESSLRGVKAMQDIVYTDIASGMREFNLRTYQDPVRKVKDIEDYVRKYLVKNESKLIHVPGFDKHPEVMRKVLKDLGDYSAQMKELDDQKNLGILSNITGPGRTITDIANDPTKAEEMANTLDSMVNTPTEGLSAEQIRKTMFNSLAQKFTNGDKFDGSGMLKMLEGEQRHNLTLVLGDQQVMKLEAMSRLSQALKTGETTLTESLQNDALLKGMDDVGFGLGRMGSVLSRRVSFRPSTGYLAGAMMAKVLDGMTQKQTARSLKVLMDNPFDLMEMDNFVLKTMGELTEKKQKIIDRSLRNRNLKGLVGWFDKAVAKTMMPHLTVLGYKTTESEVANMFKEFFLEEINETDSQRKTNDEETTVPPQKPVTEQPMEEPTMAPPAEEVAPVEGGEAPVATPAPVITNVPDIQPRDSISALSTRKSIGEIRNGS